MSERTKSLKSEASYISSLNNVLRNVTRKNRANVWAMSQATQSSESSRAFKNCVNLNSIFTNDFIMEKIFRYLSSSELQNCRLVSKAMKIQADKVLTLRHELLILGDVENGIPIFRSSFKKLFEYLPTLYSNITSLQVGTSNVPLQMILKTMRGKFPRLKKLKIYDCNCDKEVCKLIADVFPHLKQLTLIDLETNDENLKVILSNLNLERVSIQGVTWLTGEFINSIENSVQTLKYRENNLGEYNGEQVVASLEWKNVKNVLSITRLDLKVKALGSNFFASLSKLTPNLKSLVFDSDDLPNLSDLKLSLTELSIKILGTFEVPYKIEPLETVKTLNLELWIKEDICLNLINLLSAFPSIKILSFFNYSGSFSFKKKFLKVLGEMSNLEKFTFRDWRDEERFFFRFPNGQRYNVLLRAIDWLDRIKEFNFEVDAFSKRFCTELVAAMQFHAEQRPDQQINITFRVYEAESHNFIKIKQGYPPNFKVEIDYW